MDWDRRRFDDRRGGESYRPADRPGRSPSRGYDARSRRSSPPRNRSHLRADTWVPSSRGYGRPRSRSPLEYRRRSRTPPFQGRGYGPPSYGRRRSPPRRFSPRRDERIRSPPSWRSKSPHSEGRSRDASRGRSSPGRNRDMSPGGQDMRLDSRTTALISGGDKSARPLSPKAQSNSIIRSSSPSQKTPRRDSAADFSRGQSHSRPRQISSSFAHHSETDTTTQRMPLAMVSERRTQLLPRSRSRSPLLSTSPHQSSTVPGATTHRDRGANHDPDNSNLGRSSGNLEGPASDTVEPVHPWIGANIPTQPRSLALRQSPPTGPSQGPRANPSQPRGSHNSSFLSAPTRPRRGIGSRDGPWPNGPISRRGPPVASSHSAPSGPRASFAPNITGGGYRHPGPRQNSHAPTSSLPLSKGPNHLAGLATVVPTGRALPSVLDVATEKRLSQLEADQERLLQQMTEIQRSKRTGLRDWERLDHESSICSLKSELAEGHLQRMTDESIGGGIPF